jgi:cbb3-type cytochrome oxidase subunit 1
VLGFAGFIALGGMWHVLPLATGRRLYSRRLVNLQFALILFGLIGFFAVLTTAGLVQGSAWYQGEGVYKTLPQIAIFMVLRAMLGLFIIAGAVIGLCNAILTAKRGEPFEASMPEGDAKP